MKRALLVGIDYYANMNGLKGCANDVRALLPLLARNEDNSPNLHCLMVAAEEPATALTREMLLQHIDRLLAPGADFALFYFAGHGSRTGSEVTLVTSDGTGSTVGVRFSEVLEKIKASKVQEVIIILDCCFSGGAGAIPLLGDDALLPNGLSVLTASRSDQVSMETPAGRGQFSTYLEGGLEGGAADVLGHITVAGLFSYLSESFGAWDQRPTFKANIDRLHDVRMCEPAVSLSTLRQLPTWFPTVDHEFALDPSYEPDAVPPHPEHEKIFSELQKCRAVKLVEPVGHVHMYYAAMQSLGCRLTRLGQHYWAMAEAGQI
ncbi:Caspase domain-containing protein [Streptosporangium subroseum]|uniref:Caspase domain-containing protein n=1 Tax=Streptosporangium subroseum TaxID=106412 RepID=A0A239P4E1_9ACTN|nr:caspase family protein [Streptosporangium subroseum]SNT61900.1 Caspase domain-containing protein [Streptosporangium subroseum]